jgi:Flp pilus assembly protein TadD
VAALALAGCSALGLDAEGTNGAPPLSSSQAASVLRLARAARTHGDLTTSVNFYRDLATRAHPDDAVLVEYGNALIDFGAADDAIDTFARVPTNSSSRVAALLGQSHAYLALGDPKKALDTAEQAKALAPADPRVQLGIGVALDSLDRHRDAQALYRALLVDNPRHVAARNNLALSLALIGQFSEALEIITPMAKSLNATSRVRQNLALIYGLMGDRSRAEAVSRLDLDAPATASNLRFFEQVRGTSG